MTLKKTLTSHCSELHKCQMCPEMVGPVVSGAPVISSVMLVGQAPGTHEGAAGKPFAWTAGKTMFGWFDSIGLDEASFRDTVYMAAVCRCFPGKNPKGGDRVPSKIEIGNCKKWLDNEIDLLSPKLVLPVGKLAISQFLKVKKLVDVIGGVHTSPRCPTAEVIPLPHPSGASTWHRTEPGKTLLQKALSTISSHEEWQRCRRAAAS